MSSRREVLIRILPLLQRKTLIKPKNRTLKCLKRHYLTVRSMKNVAVLTEDGAFALFFRPHSGGFDSSRVPTPGNLPSKAKKMPGVSPGGGGVWAQVELTDALWRQRDNHKETTMPCMQVASKHLSARHFYTIILPG